MLNPYRLVAVLFVIGAVAFYVSRSRVLESADAESSGASEAGTKGGDTQEAGPTDGSGGPGAAPSGIDTGVPIPEELRDPNALDPEPLKVTFASQPFERQDDGRIFKTDEIRRAGDLHAGDQEPVADLQILDAVIASYRTIFRQNPIAGENREVVEALTGRNAYRLVFLDPDHPAVNARNELTDRWGTPYRFHPVSGTHMEISSAGPDGQFGTNDDFTLDEPAGESEGDGQ